jgi:very-short-patch-repair endonuclease
MAAINFYELRNRESKKTFTCKEGCESPAELKLLEEAKKHCINLVPQHPILSYRVDFIVANTKIIVEVDGSKWHSTKDQLTADYSRQRLLERTGYRVVRFTAKEIFQNAPKCIGELTEFIDLVQKLNK